MLTELNELKKIQILLNDKYFDGELPDALITIQGSMVVKGDSWFFPEKWIDNDGNIYHEINICGESLNKGKLVIMTAMLHSMIHMYCYLNNIADVSRGNNYHNRLFQMEAAKRDLIAEKTDKRGFYITKPSIIFEKFVNESDIKDVFTIGRVNSVGESSIT